MIKAIFVCSIANPEHAIAVLRIAGPMKVAGVQVHWHQPGSDLPLDVLAQCDLVVIQRDFPRLSREYFHTIKQAQAQKKPVVFEIDDLLWELPPDHPDRINGFYGEALWPMLNAAADADGVIVASPGLRDYLEDLNPRIWVLPNYLDEHLWPLRKPKLTDKATTIGYMGGDSHVPDLRMIANVLVDIQEEFGSSVQFKFWGLKPPTELASRLRLTWEQLQPGNYSQFAAYFLQQEADIFIAPLKENQFNCCKSAVKYLEYSALGVPVVCSQIDPYKAVVEHQETGFLAGTLEEWHCHLGELIKQPSTRAKIATQAQEHLRQEWMLSDHAMDWLAVYQQIIDAYTPDKAAIRRAEIMVSLQAQGGERLLNLEKQARQTQDAQEELADIKKSRAWKAIQMWWRWRSNFLRRK